MEPNLFISFPFSRCLAHIPLRFHVLFPAFSRLSPFVFEALLDVPDFKEDEAPPLFITSTSKIH